MLIFSYVTNMSDNLIRFYSTINDNRGVRDINTRLQIAIDLVAQNFPPLFGGIDRPWLVGSQLE